MMTDLERRAMVKEIIDVVSQDLRTLFNLQPKAEFIEKGSATQRTIEYSIKACLNNIKQQRYITEFFYKVEIQDGVSGFVFNVAILPHPQLLESNLDPYEIFRAEVTMTGTTVLHYKRKTQDDRS